VGGLLVTLLLLPRPVLSGAEATADTTDGAFRVHYTLSGADALANGAKDVSPANGVPDDVDAVLDGVSRVKKYWVDSVGMRAPLPDQGLGGSDAIDIYMRALGGPRGATHPEDVGMLWAASAWIELEPASALAPTDGDSRLGAAAGHEAHHAIQYAYTIAADKWIYEATATYVEHADFTSTALQAETDAHYVALLEHPEIAIDTVDGQHEYDEFAFVRFLIDISAGADKPVADLWSSLPNNERDALAAAGHSLYDFGDWLATACSRLGTAPAPCSVQRQPAAKAILANTSMDLPSRALLYLNLAIPPQESATVNFESITGFSYGVIGTLQRGEAGGSGSLYVDAASQDGTGVTRMLVADDGGAGNVSISLAWHIAPSARNPGGCALVHSGQCGTSPLIVGVLLSLLLAFRERRRGGRART
jgi:hypothetical protein